MNLALELTSIPAWRISPSNAPTIAMREAVVLLHVDGVSTVQTIIALARLPEEDVLKTLTSLVARGVLELRPSGASEGPPSAARPREERWTFSVEGESPTGVRSRTLEEATELHPESEELEARSSNGGDGDDR